MSVFPGRLRDRIGGGLCLMALLALAVPGLGTAGSLEAQFTPPPPEDLEAVAVGPHQIDLAWQPPDGSDDDDDDDWGGSIRGYNVYRDGVRVGSTEETSFSDESVEPGTTYRYRVTAVNSLGIESDPSKRVKVTTPTLDRTPPTIPEDLVARALEPTEVELAWSASEDERSPVEGYRVFRDGSNVGSTAETTFTDSGLEPNTTYVYRVSAVDTAGNESERSEPAEVTTPPVDTEPPTVPRDVVATPASPTSVDVTWSPSEDDLSPVEEYRVFRDGSNVGSTVETSFTDTGLEPSTTYLYRVSAVDTAGNESDRSEPAEATTPAEPDTTPPTIPEDLRTAAVESTRVDLVWSASEDAETGVDHYRVYRDSSAIGTTVDTMFSETGLETGTAYSFQVSAVNGDGAESGLSEAVDVVPGRSASPRDSIPPAPPTDLRIEP